MEMLNDDCWLDIFKLLDFTDQISLLQVCQQFKRVIQDIWQYEYKTVHLNLLEALLDDQQFQYFIENICDTTEVFRLKFLTANTFEILKKYQFPNAYDFRFSQMRPFFMKDEDMINISHMFPNLRTFSPHGDFSGEYMLGFNQLENLTLKYCHNFDFDCMREILKGLQLKTLSLDIFFNDVGHLGDAFGKFCELEEIMLNSQELIWMLSEEFMRSTHMKKLVITDRLDLDNKEIFFSLLHTFKAHDVLTMEISNVQIKPKMMALDSYLNLRKLTFISNFRAFRHIGHHIKSLPALRELIFSNCHADTEVQILELLKAAQQLDYISIEDCTLDFLYLVLDINEIVKGRDKVLTLNFYNNANNLDTTYEASDYVCPEMVGENDLFRMIYDKTEFLEYNPLTCTFR